MVDSTRPLVLYHGPNCPDGFCAAWLAWKKFGDSADYLPVQYGEEPPDVAGRDVFILDFSYKRFVLLDMVESANHIVVLDHHRTAQMELAELGGKKLFIRFDMKKSGARLAWEHFQHFHRDDKAPWLVDYTESRDLWTFHLPFSKEISAALASYPMTFAVWDALEKALENDPTDLRELRGKVPETAADFTRRKAEAILLSKMPL